MKSKQHVYKKVEAQLNKLGLHITQQDMQRPWGGFFVIDGRQVKRFIKAFFSDVKMDYLKGKNKLSPKILMVAPKKRLSWQYHNRRAEIWRCIDGEVEVVTSQTNEETEKHTLTKGDQIILKKKQRHRLIGLNDWGIVAEIWQHTNNDNPSDENDIVRLQDDFGR